MFDALWGNVCILVAAKTKVDVFFCNCAFSIPSFHETFWLNIDAQSGGLLVYAKRTIPTRIWTCCNKIPRTQIIVFEINLRKEKWLFDGDYKPPSA